MTKGEELRKRDESLRSFAGKAVKSACYLPFVSLHLTPTGEVMACCRNQTFILGDLRQQRITEIWNGGNIAALRAALADYRFNLGCTYCEWESQRRSDSFAIRLSADDLPVGSPQPAWPAHIDFNVSNICNLECIMCCPENSSSIRGNVMGLPPLPKVYGDQFFEDLRLFLPHLHFINFLGGEPFLAPESYRAWDMMIEEGLSIPCRVTTNGTQHNAKIERVLSAVPVHITVSLDGMTKRTYESVRHRSNFETVMANVHRFNAYTRERGTNFGIAFCLMRQNWSEVGDLVLFAERLDCELSISMVVGPSLCSLFTLPPHELRAIVDEIENIDRVIAPKLRRHRKAWEETLQQLRDATDAASLQRIQTMNAFELVSDTPLAVARRLMAAGDLEGALRKLEGLIRGHADSYFALALSGYIRGCQGDIQGAVADLDEALRLSRKLPDAYVNLARIRFRQGDVSGAMENVGLAKQRITPEERIETQLLVLEGLIHTSRWRIFPALRAYVRVAALPQFCREGCTIPESPEAARKCVAEAAGKTDEKRIQTLAGRVFALYRLAAAIERALARTRAFGLAHRIFKVAPAGKPSSSGQAAEALIPPDANGAGRWTLRLAGQNNIARLRFPGDDHENLRVDIAQALSGVSHDIQLNYSGIDCRASCSYRVKFRARADSPRPLAFGVARASAPWSNLGLYRRVQLDASWQEIEEEFVSEASEQNGRIHFDMGESAVSLELASLALTSNHSPAHHGAGSDEPQRVSAEL